MDFLPQNPYSVNPKFRITELEYRLGEIAMRLMFAGDPEQERQLRRERRRTSLELEAVRAAEAKRTGDVQ